MPARGRRLPHGFWQRFASHLLARCGEEPDGPARCFGRPFCEAVAEALGPDRSAIFVHLEEAAGEALLHALRAHGARLLRTPAAATASELVERLEAALVEVPPAETLARMAEAVETERLLEAHARRRAEEEVRRQELERLRAETLPPAEIDSMLRRCAEAARRGARRTAVLTFPAELLEDRGRRILQGEPDWPSTLAGRARAFERFFEERLAPLGYRLEAEVVGFEEGVPARFALVLDWSGARDRAASQKAQETGGGGQIAPQPG